MVWAKNKSQSMAEYAIVISVVAVALGAMGIYFKAGVQARVRKLGKQLESKPYISRMTNSNSLTTASSSTNETYSGGIFHATTNESTSRFSDETVSPETQ